MNGNLLYKHLRYTPTSGQQQLFEMLSGFISRISQPEALIVKGYAGTGKTTVISSIVNACREMRIQTVLLAPTGRAAKVLNKYSGMEAFTVHKKIYRQKSSKDGLGNFVLDKNLNKNTFFIVDEGSMIGNNSTERSIFGSGDLLNDILEYVFSGINCKLIMFGDTAQLPPVNLNLSPALNIESYESCGLKCSEITLREVIRHTECPGILHNATMLREKLDAADISIPKLTTVRFNDIVRLNGADLIDTISAAYNNPGVSETIVVCRSNKRANIFNREIRNRIFCYEEELTSNELLMVVKNCYKWIDQEEGISFIANGDIVEVCKIYGYEEKYDRRFADVLLRLIDYNNIEFKAKIMLDTLSIDAASLPADESKNFYYKIVDDYPEIKNKRKLYETVRENPYFNALQVKYAYAVTCHKSQGGQWKNVLIDQGYIDTSTIDSAYLRWLYTAITRSSEKVFLINFDNEFFLP